MAGQGSGGNVIAALCNVFIPGLGQLVQGRILAAILFFLLVGMFYSIGVFTLGIGFIIGGLLHLYCIISAARFRPHVSSRY